MGHCGGDDHAMGYVHSHPLVSVVASLEFCPLTPVAFVFYVFSILFLDCVHPRHRHPPTAFYGASKFNADLSKWNTAAVTSMASSTLTPSLFLLSLVCSLGFCSLTPIASFHISRYFYPPTAFYSAFKFNADLSKWSTANVTDMSSSTSTSSSFSVVPCFFPLDSVHSGSLIPFSLLLFSSI